MNWKKSEVSLRDLFLGMISIFFYFLLLTLLLKTIFIASIRTSLQGEHALRIAEAVMSGLRFDISSLSSLLLPAVLLYCVDAATGWRVLRKMLTAYLVFVALFILVFWFADIQYFEEAGKHFTYEFFAYLGPSGLPVVSGAFDLHPWRSSLSLMCSLGLSFVTGLVMRTNMNTFVRRRAGAIKSLVALLLFSGLGVLGVRGGLQSKPLEISSASLYSNPYLNAICLNPVFSAIHTQDMNTLKDYLFFDETSNLKTVRSLFFPTESSPVSETYPLLRESSGTDRGNGRNVVIFILESWSGNDVGCLSGDAGVTPVFDELSREGLLFRNFRATGIRTSEGIFSILCSFPNQPYVPILRLDNKRNVFNNQWRSLTQILEDIGYRNIFIHGRDLEFDYLGRFLKYIRFHDVIDRHDFPNFGPGIKDSWPGYNDEEVMQRADEEFSKQTGPFLGVVYTMNTHPPFVTPDNFPRKFPPTSDSNKFLNALNYSDHTLGTFFRLARTRPYFKNTVFLFVADHARTRNSFTLSDQHYIPFLIYSPGHVPPGEKNVVASQLDILPTVLGLLGLKTRHASWGRDLLTLGDDQGFAVSISGAEARWHDRRFLLNDGLGDNDPFLFDTNADPDCKTDVWKQNLQEGDRLQKMLRSYLSVSRFLLNQNRIYPKTDQSADLAKLPGGG